jgi:hypothetical protein
MLIFSETFLASDFLAKLLYHLPHVSLVCRYNSEVEMLLLFQNLKECSSNPCRNGGICKDLVGSYECKCFPGFTGINCEVNINECESGVCPADTECVDGIGTYQCVCKSGYPGIVSFLPIILVVYGVGAEMAFVRREK